MLSFINQQSRYELKKRQLDTNGKKNNIRKRFKTVNEKEINYLSNFNKLPNEIYCEIFDYLSSFDIINSFYGINYRLNGMIDNLPMKLNFKNLTKTQYKRILKQNVPKIISQIVSIDFEQTINSEFTIDLFIQSFDLKQFSNLRFLSLTSPNLKQLEYILSMISDLSSLQYLRLFEQDYYGSQNETVCKLILANKQHKSNHLLNVFIETSPPFKSVKYLQKYLTNKISLNSLQLHIRCSLFFYPDCITHLDYNGLSQLIPNMNYLKIDIVFGIITPAFDLIRCFNQINHLSIKTISQAYANGYQWAELLAQMPNLIKLDLNIYLDSSKTDQELQTFQTNFWLDKQWIVKYIKNSSECQIIHRDNKIR